MMKKVLAVGMLGIFLLAVAAVQPVTASHQKISLPAPAVSKVLTNLKTIKEKILSIDKTRKALSSVKEASPAVGFELPPELLIAALLIDIFGVAPILWIFGCRPYPCAVLVGLQPSIALIIIGAMIYAVVTNQTSSNF